MSEVDSAQVRDQRAEMEVLGTQEQYSGFVITVTTDQVRFPDGSTAARDVVVHPGAVGVLALDDDDRVLLVQQYRHPVRRLLWEPPAGLLDVPGEGALLAAQRELHEEAHQVARDWWVLTDTFTTPGMCDEALRIFLARGLTPVEAQDRYVGEHEEADMPVAWVPLDDAVRLVLTGQLHNPTAVVGILAAAEARRMGYDNLRPADSPWPERPTGAGSRG